MGSNKFEQIEKKAEDFLNEFQKKSGYKITLPVPVELMAKFFYKVRVTNTLKIREGISGKLSLFKRVITLNSKNTPERRNFTIAHEIGHIYLHKTTLSSTSYREKSDKIEAEANAFAASLLMPKKFVYNSVIDELIAIKIRKKDKIEWLRIILRRKSPNFKSLNHLLRVYLLKNRKGNPKRISRANLMLLLIKNLAKKFKVSKEAMAWRLKHLGLIDEFFTFRAGEKASISGEYQIIYADGKEARKKITLGKEELFPPTPRSGQRYIYVGSLKTSK